MPERGIGSKKVAMFFLFGTAGGRPVKREKIGGWKVFSGRLCVWVP